MWLEPHTWYSKNVDLSPFLRVTIRSQSEGVHVCASHKSWSLRISPGCVYVVVGLLSWLVVTSLSSALVKA